MSQRHLNLCFFWILFSSAIFCRTPTLRAGELSRDQTVGPRILPASNEGELALKRFQVPRGLKVDLFAAEPMLANPVCFAFDEKGRVFVVETFRLHAGVTDIRGHMDWLDDELASKSTAGLETTFRKFLGAKVSELTNNSERVQLVEDLDGDGKADRSTVFAEGFNSMVDGIAAGVLARRGAVYFTDVPNLWLLRDEDHDGKADTRVPLHYGFGVRAGFLGHDLHGLRFGPDGKIYFSMGDRGSNVKTRGTSVGNPETGTVFRCNPDGTELEVFATGLRNPQELVFDRYGNLFTGDNNSDGGDLARWVYLVEGGDSGWRVGWQFIEKPNSRGPWIAEKMDRPTGENHPAHIVPPVANIGNGPSGVTYYPGTGLPEEYDHHFFLADFKGSAANSLVHSFTLKPKGAGFALTDRKAFISGICVTDVEFSPDGRVFVSDWVDGWAMPGKGRLYRIYDETIVQSPLVLQTKKLLAEGMERRSIQELISLLAFPDQRVRQEAQFALAEKKAEEDLLTTVLKSTNQMARLHAIWGMGQIAAEARRNKESSSISKMAPLLSDSDAEVRAQVARILGDHHVDSAYDALASAVKDPDGRVRFFAAMSLGKLGRNEAVPAIAQMLRDNRDEDPYLRHAGVMALARINDLAQIVSLGRDESSAVRLAALLALRRLERPEIETFLADADPRLVLEAARAINDASIQSGLPALARLLEKSATSGDPLVRRVLNAQFRIGSGESAVALAQFSKSQDAREARRVEALQMLGDWARPSGRDRVTGLWRPLPERRADAAVAAIRPVLNDLLRGGPAEIRAQAAALAGIYNIADAAPVLTEVMSDRSAPSVARVAALKSLGSLNAPGLKETVKLAAGDADENLRQEATRWFAKLNPEDATAQLILILDNGTISEQQNAFATLATLKDPQADTVIGQWLDRMKKRRGVKPELQLDLLEAATKRSSDSIRQKLREVEGMRKLDDALAPFRATLAGGNKEEGRKIFFERPEASCLRCHKVGDEGGEVGPLLTDVGKRQTREYLLESIVIPNKQIAKGFETIIATLRNGTAYAGTLKSEDENELVLNSPEDGVVTIKKSEIDKRERGLSGMPEGMGDVLSKRDLRDLIEYLANLK